MEDKKPDQVVYNTDTQEYDAGLKPYATNVGAPAIKATDTSSWKLANIYKVNKSFEARFAEIHKQYLELSAEYERNQLVYSAAFNFKPNVGEVYHLYRDANMAPFLSIINPNECNFDHIGSYRFSSDKIWEEISAN